MKRQKADYEGALNYIQNAHKPFRLYKRKGFPNEFSIQSEYHVGCGLLKIWKSTLLVIETSNKGFFIFNPEFQKQNTLPELVDLVNQIKSLIPGAIVTIQV